MNEIEIQQQRINQWLRHHTDYKVIIDLNSVYGCIEARITKNNQHVESFIGVHIKKRLDEVITYLKIDEWEGEYKWWRSREENKAAARAKRDQAENRKAITVRDEGSAKSTGWREIC